MLPKIFRFILYPLLTFRPTYLLGMLLVRLTRKLKAKTFKKEKDFVTINNFMSNIKMRVDKNSYMGGSIYWCGFHHINELLYLRSYLSKDMTFVDIGANQGEFSLFACSKLTNGKVISFEPTSFQLNLLVKNVELNGFKNCEINRYGLFNEETQLEIYTSHETELHSGYHEGLSTLYKTETRNEVEELIELKVFDKEYFEKLDRLDFVKIDIEGAELFALQGMSKSLYKFKPQVLIEMNKGTFADAGYSFNEVFDFFKNLDYIPYKLFRGRKYKIDYSEISDFSNILFLPA